MAGLRQKLEEIFPGNGTPILDDFNKCWKLVKEHHLNLVKQTSSPYQETLLLRDGTHPDLNQFQFSMNVRPLKGTNFVGNGGLQEDIVCGSSFRYVIQIYERIYIRCTFNHTCHRPCAWLTKRYYVAFKSERHSCTQKRGSLLRKLANSTKDEVKNELVIRFPNIENAQETTPSLPFTYNNDQHFIRVPFGAAVTRRTLNRTADRLGIQDVACYSHGRLFNYICQVLDPED